MRRIHLLFGALVVVAVVALAACGSSGGSSASGNFCDLVKHYNNDKSLNATPHSFADEKNQAQALKSAIDNLTAAAPAAIKSEMQTVQHLVNELANIAKSSTNAQEFSSKSQGLQSQTSAANSASQKVNAYAKQHCGASLGSGG